jgi:L-amino acid N-acyltransferase YncA
VIRSARAEDAGALLAIYAPIVRDTAISFEAEPPPLAEFEGRILQTLKTHPWLVFEEGSGAVGYAYAGPHRVRPAYRWSVDVTAYVAEAARGRGVGKSLYLALFEILRRQGFRSAFAGIALPNAASVALHEAVGMTPIGVYHDVGFKLGAWRDVGWWGLRLTAEAAPPHEPIPFAEL